MENMKEYIESRYEMLKDNIDKKMIEKDEVFGGEEFLRDFTNTKVVPYTNV